MLVEIDLVPNGLIAWVGVGLFAGAIAWFLMKGGYGVIGDLGMGLLGAVAGGLLYGVTVNGTANYWGGILAAFLGACVFIAVSRVLASGPTKL